MDSLSKIYLRENNLVGTSHLSGTELDVGSMLMNKLDMVPTRGQCIFQWSIQS